MSLDYILVKGRTVPQELNELEPDPAFNVDEYRALAVSLFRAVEWLSDGRGYAERSDISIELHPDDSGLSLWCRGSGDIASLINEIALAVHGQGVVVIDVQTSQLIAPENPLASPDYVAWYRAVTSDARG